MTKLAPAVLCALLALPVAGQQPVRREIADFPTCASAQNGAQVIATDPVDAGDCTAGGGAAAPHPCFCDGATATYRPVVGDEDVQAGENAIRFTPSPGAGATAEVIHVGVAGGTLIIEPLDEELPAVDAQDDGRSRGGSLRTAGFCSTATKCAEGQGDCSNDDARCQAGTFCRQNIGRTHAVAATAAACSTAVDICIQTDYWCGRTCTADDPCRAGQGDCAAADGNCSAGLRCRIDAGASWDCGATVDVCESPAATCEATCSAGSPCATGTGPCTAGSECTSGVCTLLAGAYYGCQPTVGICE